MRLVRSFAVETVQCILGVILKSSAVIVLSNRGMQALAVGGREAGGAISISCWTRPWCKYLRPGRETSVIQSHPPA